MIADVITAIVSGFSDVLGKSLGRYRYLAILVAAYFLAFLFGMSTSAYFYFIKGVFRWDMVLFDTLLLGSIFGFGGVFIAFVNRAPSGQKSAKPDDASVEANPSEGTNSRSRLLYCPPPLTVMSISPNPMI